MCFLKIGDPLSPCEHEECKKALQALQMSNCLYTNANKFPSQMIYMPQPQYIKRQRNEISSDGNQGEENGNNIVKKVKIDANDVNTLEKKTEDNEENMMKFFNLQQIKGNSCNNVNNNQNSFNIKHPINISNQNNNDNLMAYLLLNTNNNENAKNSINMPMYSNLNQPFSDSMLNLSMAPQIFNQTGFENQNFSTSKDFLNKVFSIISAQNKIIMEIKEKNNLLFENVTKLTHEFQELKSFVFKTENETHEKKQYYDQNEKLQESVNASINIIGIPGETITSKDLMHYLYGSRQDKFMYKLQINSELELPLYRERNFSFSICLTDMHDNRIVNTNRIPISVAIYTYENPPKCLDTNTAGNKILKGNIEKDLVNGYCFFEKIQIKEVTSHFRKGHVFVVVYPKMPTFGNLCSGAIQQNFVDFTTIKPFILEKVVVKAKKINCLAKNVEHSETKEEDADISNEKSEHEQN